LFKIFNVAIVGAGCWSKRSCLCLLTKNYQHNHSLQISGTRKLSIVGNNRCNTTNTLPYDDFLEEYGKNGMFILVSEKGLYKNKALVLACEGKAIRKQDQMLTL